MKNKKKKLYRCNPFKNAVCPKTNCYLMDDGPCRHTIDKKYKMTIMDRFKMFLGIEPTSGLYYFADNKMKEMKKNE